MDQINKYQETLKKYDTNLSYKEIEEKVNKIINEKYKENDTKEVLKKIYSCIDLTSLNSTDTKEDIWKLTEKVNNFEGNRPDIENIAAICVYPNFVETVKEALTAQNVKIACVSGGFPSSQTFMEIKIAETALAVSYGADEIDIVLNLGMFLEENYEELAEEIDEIKHSCKNSKLKVILETGALEDSSKIKKAAILALYSGADFLKTSTGKVYKGATLETAYIICSTLKEYYKETGIKIGFKASGGISTTEDAIKYYTIVKEVLGQDWCNNNLFRIGTSRLVSKIIDNI